MKKLTLLLMTLILFNLSFAKEKVDTTFTFQGFSPSSQSIVRTTQRTRVLGSSRISYPVFVGRNSDVTKNMNKNMEKFISGYKSSKNKTYIVTSEITASNSSFVSVLFSIEERDAKTRQTTKVNDAISFNLKSGKPLLLKDLFLSGYEDSLKTAINEKFNQLGLPQVDKFDAISKRQNFYLNNDSLVLIYHNSTSFADGQVFVPFLLTDLIGILK